MVSSFLSEMTKLEASDLYLKEGCVPTFRVDGELVPGRGKQLTVEDMEAILREMMSAEQRQEFMLRQEADLAHERDGIGRFRLNAFRQRGRLGIVLRLVRSQIPSFSELNLPGEVLQKLCEEQRGLILVTGTAGSGKSTTLAAMVEYINSRRRVHIVTIEDPIEFVHEDKLSMINQREVGLDTDSFATALRHVVRQSPDVILLGEMRDLDTISAAMSAAETGHLVLSTLHTVDAAHALERIMNYYPPYQHEEVRVQLSFLLKGVISLRLLPRAQGTGRVPAVAMMIVTPTIRELIREGKTEELSRVIEQGGIYGMRTFNQALMELYRSGVVSFSAAEAASDSPQDFRLISQGIRSGPDSAGG